MPPVCIKALHSCWNFQLVYIPPLHLLLEQCTQHTVVMRFVHSVLVHVVGERISKLEKWFSGLKSKILSELRANQTPEMILGSLAMLPLSLQAEYRNYVMENLSTLAAAASVTMMFVRLSFQFTFIDYGLLEHLIETFGSEQLKQDMSAYAGAVQVFLDETTVEELKDHWPGQRDMPAHFEEIRAIVYQNPKIYSLRQLDDLRRNLCGETKLSEMVFILKRVGKANSFSVSWLVPSVLVSELIESLSRINESFYEREFIYSISVNQQQLYFSVAMREKNVC